MTTDKDRQDSDADGELATLYQREWQWRTDEIPDSGFLTMTDPPSPALPEVSADRQDERRRYWQAVRADLDRIDPDRLSPESRTHQRVYRHQLTTLINQQRMRMYQRPANADSSFWGDLFAGTRRVLSDTEHAQRYLDQLGTVAGFVEANIVNMRDGVARGFGPPRVTMVGRDAPIRSMAATQDPASSSFCRPLRTLPPTVDPAVVTTMVERATRIVADEIVPAFQRLATFYADEYLPRLPEAIAAVDQPDGEQFYQTQLDEYSTSGWTGEQIHHIGLEQVAAIQQEMQQVATDAGYADAPSMFAFMRSDPQFVETTPIGLLRRAAWHAKQFDEVSGRYFGRLPRMRFGIAPPDPDIAPFYTAGRGGPGRYTLNTYNLPARKLYSLPALTLHEAAPGHAFQIPFALEMTHLPDFRRKDYISAYGEGWALYTERLGVDMGMYDTPFEVMGMLSYQMWRAVRLVIDPGIHVLGWSRERAQAYLRDNTALDDHEVTTEVDRYIAWPGQATAYYLGMMRVLDGRAAAERRLGAAFSLPAFHDLVLSLGSVPLDVLGEQIDAFIAGGGHSPFEDQE